MGNGALTQWEDWEKNVFLASLPLIALGSFSSFHHYGSIDFGETLVIVLQMSGSHLNFFLCGINEWAVWYKCSVWYLS